MRVKTSGFRRIGWRPRWLKILLVVAGLCRALQAGAAEIPEGEGICIHFVRGHLSDLRLIAACGFRFVRTDLSWKDTERRAGMYDFSGYDELASNISRVSLRPLFILDYSNPVYCRAGISPDSPESRAAFARWAAAAVRRFPGAIWEIWNEPNSGFWKPWPDAREYLALAIPTARAIRRADPTATIFAPAVLHFDWKFIQSVVQSPLPDLIDGFSVHPYIKASVERALPDYERLERMLVWRSPWRTIPVICSEWGISCFEGRGGATSAEQAVLFQRLLLTNLAAGVPFSLWYDWKDDGSDPREREHHFGLVDRRGRFKPSYYAAREILRELNGFRLERRVRTNSSNDYLLLFRDTARREKLVAWTTASAHDVALADKLRGHIHLCQRPKFLKVAPRLN
jgi:hypothetical protein